MAHRHGPVRVVAIVAVRGTVRAVREQERRKAFVCVGVGVPQRSGVDSGHERGDFGARSGHRHRGFHQAGARAGAADGPGRDAQGVDAECGRQGAEVFAGVEALLLSQKSRGAAEVAAGGVGAAGDVRNRAGALLAVRGTRRVPRVVGLVSDT